MLNAIEDSQKTLSAVVQERIRAAILDGTLPAGSRLDQAQLATDLNVSLVPLREALKKLEAEGFVQIVPRRGAFVTSTSVRDMDDLYFAREVLEGEAAFHAAPRLTSDHLAQLGSLMASMNQALEQQDYERFNLYNRHFHFTIYNAASSTYLANMIKTLWDLAERYRYRYLLIKDRAAIIQSEHQTILDACHAQNGEQLRAAIISHLRQTLTGIRGYVTTAEQAENERR